MLILNSGGTFNKRYDPIKGELVVPFDNVAIESILRHNSEHSELAGVLYKDSLDMTQEDRATLCKIIAHSQESQFLLVHGTDTMSKSAAFIAEIIEDKTVVLTGAMVPFSIDGVEATANFALAFGFLQASPPAGVYIAMHGLVLPHNEIIKDYQKGQFVRK